MKTFYITTAIDYTNAPPHLGHAYEKILADVLARYHRAKGEPVFFLTGVDQHGQKVQQAAMKAGLSPGEFVRETTAHFTALWSKLELSHDRWAETTYPLHQRCVRKILETLHARGEIYRATYRGFYSVRQEQFLTDKERGPDGRFAPEWGEVIELEEENWYFRLEKYRSWLLEFLDAHPECVQPRFRLTELRNAAERLAGDLSISRPKSRLAWGIEMPFDPECVTYVWFDALVNYISFAGYGEDEAAFHERGPALHVIGKDILVPAHGIYWLAMLKAMGFADAEMPRFLVHGYVLVAGSKMSKSLGNIRDPNIFANIFGVEPLRYYLMRDCVVGQDMEFTDERLVQRANTDLANGLGNLLSRTLTMAGKYCGGKLTPSTTGGLRARAEALVASYIARMDAGEVSAALEAMGAFVTEANQFVEQSAPWKLAKLEGTEEQIAAILYHLAESLRHLAILISPVTPRAASEIFRQLNWRGSLTLSQAVWGLLPDGHAVNTPTALFRRLEAPADGAKDAKDEQRIS